MNRRRTFAREVRRAHPERHKAHSIAMRIAIPRNCSGSWLNSPSAEPGELIVSIHVHFRDAGLRSGMVGRRVPCAF